VCETTVALVVRAGNPKQIFDWEDLIKPGVEVSYKSCSTLCMCMDLREARVHTLQAWCFACTSVAKSMQ